MCLRAHCGHASHTPPSLETQWGHRNIPSGVRIPHYRYGIHAVACADRRERPRAPGGIRQHPPAPPPVAPASPSGAPLALRGTDFSLRRAGTGRRASSPTQSSTQLRQRDLQISNCDYWNCTVHFRRNLSKPMIILSIGCA